MITPTAWNNGQHYKSGAGYGLKISSADGDRYFRREWRTVQLRIGTGEPIFANIDKASFWNSSCRELISAEVGRWMLANGLAPWPSGQPPRLRLPNLEYARFPWNEGTWRGACQGWGSLSVRARNVGWRCHGIPVKV
jgi:hypothetical protein